ncbi:CheF family chemotaxis protein [Halomicrobium salinisoli]|uniref:CheF family chemotaxis protein n=1 Tax=Halomicrobium salinisoli TaxID=2878391 RepID=UPI001CF04980|nr:CheF family chemotaxis protein [Halomicrobium salinisoli]
MSDEQKLADAKGKFVQVVADGRKRNDIDWVPGRILLSNRRLLLVGGDGKRTIPLSEVTGVTGRDNVTQAIAKVSGYLSVQIGSDVFLVAPQDVDAFEADLFDALLDQTTVVIKHPAVEGGVVQDSEWEKGRLTVETGADPSADLATAAGTFVELPIDDVGHAERTKKTVKGSERPVLEVEHAIEGTSMETHVAGTAQDVAVLGSFLRRGDSDADDVDLTKEEHEVLMALYTGVSPFQIPDFVGMDVDQVEAIFDDLVEQGVLEEVRTRREIQLEARGRSIAGDAMSEQ